MTSDIGERWLIALAGVVALLLGGWTAFEESAQNFRGGSTPMQRLLNMPDDEAPIGVSILSQSRALLDCEVTLRSARSIEAMYLPPGDLARLVPLCRALADSVTAWTPSMSLAWLVAAAAAADSGDLQAFSDSLVRSQLTAPNEFWLAKMRLRLADAHLENLGPEAVAGYEGDLRVTAFDPYEVWILARRYVADESFRTRMQAALESSPSEMQARFLDHVSQVLSSEGR